MSSAPLPAPGRARYILIVIVLLMTGSLAGEMVYRQFRGRVFDAAWGRCLIATAKRHPGINFRHPAPAIYAEVQRCVLPDLIERPWYLAAGATLVMMLGLLSMKILPIRLVRQAGPLQPSRQWQSLADYESEEMGIGRPPDVHFGALRLREAFTVPGLRRSRVVLPPAITSLPARQGVAIMRHELAHVAAGDVTLVWLTRGTWAAVCTVLLLPVLTAVVREPSNEHLRFAQSDLISWPEYLVRSLVLLLLTRLLSLAVLRSREHEADLRAAEGGSSGELAELLHTQPAQQRSWWRRVTAIHPDAQARAAVLLHPYLAANTPVADLTTVFFAVATTSAVSAITGYLLRFTPMAFINVALVGLIQGVLIGWAWGVPVWRNVSAAHADGRVPRVRDPILGLLAGTLLGIVLQGGTGDPLSFVAIPLALAGAGAVSTVMASIWARRRRTGQSPRRAWIVAAAMNALLLGGAYWYGVSFVASIGDHGPWAVGLVLPAPAILWLAVVVTATMIWSYQGHSPVPASILFPICAVVSGTVVIPMWIVGDGGHNIALLLKLDLIAALSVGISCLLSLVIVAGRSGFGLAIAAAPLASLTTHTLVWLERPSYPLIYNLTPWAREGMASLNYVAFAIIFLALPAILARDWSQRQKVANTKRACWTALATTIAVTVVIALTLSPPSGSA